MPFCPNTKITCANNMPFVTDVHAVLSLLDVIGPDGRFDESPGSVIAQVIDGGGDIFEIARCINVELIKPDFCDGCCEHVTDIPPGVYQLVQSDEDEEMEDFKHYIFI